MKTAFIGLVSLALMPAAYAGDIHITFSEEMVEDLQDDYGMREADYLTEQLREDITQEFDGKLDMYGDITVEIVDAKPNRPTFQQMGDTPGLSMRSVSLGGAKLTGSIEDLDGNVISVTDYRYYENDIRAVVGRATWSDANRAFDRFARKLAKDVEAAAPQAAGDDVS